MRGQLVSCHPERPWGHCGEERTGSHEAAGKLSAKLVAAVFLQNSSGPEDLSPGPRNRSNLSSTCQGVKYMRPPPTPSLLPAPRPTWGRARARGSGKVLTHRERGGEDGGRWDEVAGCAQPHFLFGDGKGSEGRPCRGCRCRKREPRLGRRGPGAWGGETQQWPQAGGRDTSRTEHYPVLVPGGLALPYP